MRLLDLFCDACGSAMGFYRAGFDEIIGVDITPQKNYPFEFVQADALEYLDTEPIARVFDVVHASPPCQAHSAGRHLPFAAEHPDLIAITREALDATGLPYIIENVPGAPLKNYVILCGESLGLGNDKFGLARHRLFETNWPIGLVPPCSHGWREVLGVYGSRPSRSRGKTLGERWLPRPYARQMAQEVMKIDWMTSVEMTQAIPPAYTEFIGLQLLEQLQKASA